MLEKLKSSAASKTRPSQWTSYSNSSWRIIIRFASNIHTTRILLLMVIDSVLTRENQQLKSISEVIQCVLTSVSSECKT